MRITSFEFTKQSQSHEYDSTKAEPYCVSLVNMLESISSSSVNFDDENCSPRLIKVRNFSIEIDQPNHWGYILFLNYSQEKR